MHKGGCGQKYDIINDIYYIKFSCCEVNGRGTCAYSYEIYTLDFILEKIGKEMRIKDILKKARIFTNFIYNHRKILSLMCHFTPKKEAYMTWNHKICNFSFIVKSF